ncbi:organophopsphate acid anhydrase [Streptomyces sp. F001]|uniref:amidohydrolase family protein n=1 Tax=Streptomyces sp. F001 TaxID=1510026 RepID=UPI00101E77C7|nr:amidohydrolase family protein [Streptomyces sp. F001]RZB14582.1 organophopsphate acid anhydrase [Streptomyces sp. F001]
MSTPTYYTGLRLISGDGSAPVDDAVIAVRDGIVESVGTARTTPVPAGARQVDLTGKTVMPTIVNPHGHIGYLKDGDTHPRNFSRANVLDHLRRLTYYGVSVFQSLGTDRDGVELAVRDAQRSGELSDPALALLFSAGAGLVAPTSDAENAGPFFATDVLHEVTTPEQARRAVREVAATKPDVIKFWIDDRWGQKAKFGPDIAAAIIHEAHAHGLRAIAHIFELDDAKAVLRAGADGIAHMVREPGPDLELIELLLEHDAFVFTSMSIQTGFFGDMAWLDDPALAESVPAADRAAVRSQMAAFAASVDTDWEKAYAVLESGLRELVDSGVRVLLSADTGVGAQFPGFAEHRELEAMVRAGMPPLEAIRAATLLPAEMLGLPDRGSIAPGKRADLLVLDADPLQDIAHTRRIAQVIIGGTPIDRRALRAAWEG